MDHSRAPLEIMPLRYLLDTNILSELVRKPQGIVATRIAAVGEDTVCTSIIVAAELRYGAIKSSALKLAQQVDMVLSAMEVLPLKQPVDCHYWNLRHQLTSQGMPIGPNDLLIAAHALSSGLIMVTANTKEFSRISQLKIEN